MTARTYCGCTPPTIAPAPRDPVSIATELHDAAEVLADFAAMVAGDDYTDATLTSADALLTGCSRLLIELRARRPGGQHGRA